MAKLLVTGGAGFIGSNFIRMWLSNNPDDKIVNLDKLSYAADLRNLDDLSSSSRYHFVKGDICDFKLLTELMKDVDLVVNFAAETHVDRSIENSSDFIKTNVEGTRSLLEAARVNGGLRFHHVSTDEVFGSLSLDDPKFNEETPYDPRSPYSASKASSDHLVRAYYHTYSLPITISNCSNNYGPYQFPEKLIPLFILKLLKGQKVPVYGSGNNIRDWIHVDDHNMGVEKIIKKGKIGDTYCLGGGNERSNLDITHQILKILNLDDTKIEYVSDRLGHDFRYAIDFSKARDELGFEPQVSFEKGLLDTVNWYKNKVSFYEESFNIRS